MKIKRLVIENFKSIERIELVEPNPFTVFVGPNGSGKSNIFEALEFHVPETDMSEKFRLFGGSDYLQNRTIDSNRQYFFSVNSDLFTKERNGSYVPVEEIGTKAGLYDLHIIDPLKEENNRQNYDGFVKSFSRIFVKNDRLQKQNYNDDSRLNLSCSNLEKVLKRVLLNSVLKNEIFEWLELFVPGFKAVNIDDRNELQWFEESHDRYFIKDLISDGTYNILAMLTAVYQIDDKPQFLCIEEPENGLHPQVARELVDFFRIMCEERGHHIWLNTHSQSMMSRVRPEEMVIVDKKQGATRIKQISENDFKNWRMDEALLMNAFGGGLAW